MIFSSHDVYLWQSDVFEGFYDNYSVYWKEWAMQRALQHKQQKEKELGLTPILSNLQQGIGPVIGKRNKDMKRLGIRLLSWKDD